MKKRFLALGLALLISGVAFMSLGAYTKYEILRPLDLGQDESIVALPFLLLTDDGLRYAIEEAKNTLPSDEEPTEPPTLPPATTGEPTTEPTTGPTTEPTTGPATEPATEPSEPTSIQPSDDPDTGRDEETLAIPDPPTTPTEAEKPTQPPTTRATSPSIDYSQGAVPASWYDDVLFIGDSRTCGLRDYARSGNADYFCAVGMSVFNIQDKTAEDVNFSNQTLRSLLSKKTYGKIFISLGINECGYPLNSLMSAYKKLVDMVRDAQPDAVIILQGIMTVTQSKANSASYFSVANIEKINTKIAAMADGSSIYYIDVNTAFADERGYLPNEMSGDGCHLYAKYYKLWSEWIGYAVAQLEI